MSFRIYKVGFLFLFLFSIAFLVACTESAKVTINFDSNGGSFVSAITTDGSSSITLPPNPTRDGYSFGGWYWDNETFNDPFTANSLLDRPVSSDLTVGAKWQINQYTITFDTDGGSEVTPITQDYATPLTVPIDPTKEGHTFTGWSPEIPEIMPAEHVILKAQWTINQYTIIFNSNGGSSVQNITLNYNDHITSSIPTRSGYTFGGWYSNQDLTTPYTSNKMPAQNLTLYAKWHIIDYAITYVLDGGTNHINNPSSYTSTSGVTLVSPIKEGHTFGGWYDNQNFEEEAITEIPLGTMEAVTLYAKWTINQYTITYNMKVLDPLSHIPLLHGETIIQVSLGVAHSSALTSSGRLFMWGNNSSGQLGDDTTINKSVPTEITSRFSLRAGDKIIQVSLGGQHSSALTSSGRLFMWGYNLHGQLGDHTTTHKSVPTEITSRFSLLAGDKIIQVSLEWEHSSALTSNGRLFMWGGNWAGQLGDSTTANRSVPTEITSRFSLLAGDKIIQVSLGSNHSSALTSSGRLFMWGRNAEGQLGDQTFTHKYGPTEITSRFSLMAGDKIIQVSLGSDYSSALTSNGRLFMWGRNAEGQLGDQTFTHKYGPTEITSRLSLGAGDKIIQVSLGYSHSSALTSNGRLFMWGGNNVGQLGDTTTTHKSVPTEITSHFLSAEGDKIIQVSLGSSHSSAGTSSGRLFTWGLNSAGQLGDHTTTSKSIGVSLVDYLLETAIVEIYNFDTQITSYLPILERYTFGGWYSDQDLTTLYIFNKMPAQNLTLYAKWHTIDYAITYVLDGGTNHINNPSSYSPTSSVTLLSPIKEGYTFGGWYDNQNFEEEAITKTPLGAMEAMTLYAKWEINQYTITYNIMPKDYDPLSHITLLPGETIIQVSLGWDHSSALTSQGRLFMWGNNALGQLGDNTTTRKFIPTDITSRFSLAEGDKIIQVSMGWEHSSALTSHGRLFTWGLNLSGQLGDNTTTRKLIPTEITSRFSLEAGDKIIQVSLGGNHTSALTLNGRLFMWGDNSNGILGDNTTTRKLIPTEITNRFSLLAGDKIIQVSLGSSHSSAVTSSGRLFTWGLNSVGRLGDNTTISKSVPTEITNQFSLTEEDKIIQVSLGHAHSSALTANGRLFMWGYNNSGQLGDGASINRFVPTEITSRFSLGAGETIIEVSLGSSHSSALISSGRLFMWGDNYYGQLGDDTTTRKTVPTEITSHFSLVAGDKIIQVSLGSSHSSAWTSSGRLFTWGLNSVGQLGDNTTTHKSIPISLIYYFLETIHAETYSFNSQIISYLPVLEGYTFSGWFIDSYLLTPYVFTTMPAEDIILYGYWIAN